MKKAIIILFLAGMVVTLKAQFLFPSLIDSSAINGAAKKDSVVQTVTDLIQSQSGVEVKPEDSANRTIKKSEQEVKRLEIQAQKIKLEKEIAILQNKEILSPEEKEILKLKHENLKLVLEKEKLYLEDDINQAKKLSGKKNLPPAAVYGHQYFRDDAFGFYQNTKEITPTENYVLGTGDVVQLEVWGSRYWSKSYTVNESGAIDLVGYQKLFVKGLSLRQVREMIGSRLGLNGSESSFSVNVTRPRMVTVNILGEVFTPGSYSVPATNTVFNALVSMGGPSNIGSVRNIYIKRDGKIRDSFDLYEYFNDVRHQRDVYLQNNDYVIVMPLNNVVTVSGSVRRQGSYEIKAGEKLTDLIRFAGGNFPNTYLRDVVISRVVNNEYQTFSINADSLFKAKKDFKLLAGDQVDFKEIRSDNQYTILISGSVSVPGTYRVKSGMKISDVLKTANGVTSNAFMERAYLVRTNADLSKSYLNFSPQKILNGTAGDFDFKVENRDSIYIFNKAELQKFYNVSITGAVYKPSTMRYIEGLKLSDLFYMSGGLTADADSIKGYIIRTNSDLDKTLIYFEPSKVMGNFGDRDIELLPRDEVTIFSKTANKRFYTLEIQGPVKTPQSHPYSENTRITDMINLSGGLEASAFKGRGLVILTNLITGYKTVKTFNLQQILDDPSSSENVILPKNAVVRLFDMSELRNDFQVSAYGEVRKPGDFAYADNMTLQNLVDLAGGIQFISAGTSVEVVRNFYMEDGNYKFLKPKIYFTKVLDNLQLDSQIKSLILQPFDRVFIRKNPDYMPLKMVYISGAVKYPGFYALQSENEKISSLYSRAGGFRTDADTRGVKVKRTRGNGDTIEVVLNSRRAIHRRRSPYNIILRGGDFVYVPYAENLVTISGDVNKFTEHDVAVYYTKHKRARYYIRNFGGGFTESSDRKHVVVIRSNGARVASQRFLFFRIYPKIKPGSKIVIVSKVDSSKANAGKKANSASVDTFLQKLLTRATAVLSLMGLYKIAIAK